MRLSLRIWVGLYGLAFHAVAAAAVVGFAVRNRAQISGGFWSTAIPAMLVSAFAVYALVVAPYVPRRRARRGAVLFDSVVGMLAEIVLVAAMALLYAGVTAWPALAEGGVGPYLGATASTAVFAFLYSFANFFTQVLVVGNAAGLVGWVVLKRVGARLPVTIGGK